MAIRSQRSFRLFSFPRKVASRTYLPGGQVDFSLESRLIAPLRNVRGERSFDLSILATPLSFVARLFVAVMFPTHRRMIDFNEPVHCCNEN